MDRFQTCHDVSSYIPSGRACAGGRIALPWSCRRLGGVREAAAQATLEYVEDTCLDRSHGLDAKLAAVLLPKQDGYLSALPSREHT